MIDFSTRSLIELCVATPRLQRAVAEDASRVLIAACGAAAPAAVAVLKREYALRTALDDGWSAVPQALLPYGDGSVLVLADPGGEPLRCDGAPHVPLATFFKVAAGLTTTLGAMHAAGVVHHALTPACFLVNEDGRAFLTGFGFATRHVDGALADVELEWNDDSFVYMAPELGARMNVRVDARADLYSLGCILYQLLTGVPPFDATDTAARVHAHATHRPRTPVECGAHVPGQISRIIMKLLEKTPVQRYASATGLLADLQRCAELYQRDGHIPLFALDAHAALQRLHLPDGIVGRANELDALLALYRSVGNSGQARVAWISGHAGVGKSALLQEASACMQRIGAPLLAVSKSEESRRGMPYAILTQALEQLLQFVLGRPDQEFNAWRERIKAATALVGHTLAKFLPALAVVLGAQTDAPETSDVAPAVQRERVLQGLARLIACFAAPSRPLVLVLDDLQWADFATFDVLERLLRSHDHAAVLLLGSFRGNELDANHPLLAAGLAGAASALQMELGPLNEHAMRELISRTLQQDADSLCPLTELIGDRTGRNPLFVRHLLCMLADDGVLEYNAESAVWRWSLERMAAQRGADSVVALLTRRIEQLPVCTQFMLRLLACLGQRASTQALAVAAGLSEFEAVRKLQSALDSACVFREGEDWVFGHDRIREATYASIPEPERAQLHSHIARRQLRNDVMAADAFALAAQVNLARPVVDDPVERRIFARLNLDAGRQAKAAAAHHSALGYFRAALGFLGEDAVCEDGLLARKLCGEAEFMTGVLDTAEARLSALEPLASDGIFGADLVRLRAALYTALRRYDLALDVGLAFLRRAGIDIPAHPDTTDLDREYQRVRGWLDQHGVAALRELPMMADPLRRAITDVIADLIAPALYKDPNLFDFILLRSINLAIEQGYSDGSASVLAHTCQIFGLRYGDYPTALELGRVALYLVEEGGLTHCRARAYMGFGTFIVPWTQPARTGRPYIRRAFDAALESGDQIYALYCVSNELTGMLFAGESLADLRERGAQGFELARKVNFRQLMRSFRSKWALVTKLQDGEPDPLEEALPTPVDGDPVTLVDFAYWVYRLQDAFIFGDLADALEARRRAEACAPYGRSYSESGELPFYGALALLAVAGRDGQEEVALQRHAAQLEQWAEVCPDNFTGRSELVRAERARVEGRTLDAIEAYAKAISHARRHGFTQVEALAAELAARFHAQREDEITAQAHLRHARGAWQRWGAMGKARQLQAAHPELFAAETSAPSASRLKELDVQAVLRISHALASDIVPARLVETLLRTALESAGAGQGALALLRDGVWQVPARAQVVSGAIVVTQGAMPFTSDVLPVSVVHAVSRTRQGVVLDDPHDSPVYARDHYVRQRRPRSVLCVPLIRYATLVGVLYLENNLAAKVFTASKAAVLEVIASQAAFALENARLYEALFEQNEQRTRAEAQLRTALDDLERASRLKAMGELVASIVHEVAQPLAAADTAASAAMRWLGRNPPEVGEAQDMLRHINLSVTRVKSIIQALRAKARQAKPQFITLDLSEVLHEAVTLVARQMDTLNVTIDVRGLAQPVQVLGERIQLQQLVINLLVNGAESMATLDTARRLTLACTPHAGNQVQVSVDDNGSGIAPDIAGRLFEPLFTTKENGMGMGLAISHSIVDAHGGTLTLSPRQQGGTRAAFTLPCC